MAEITIKKGDRLPLLARQFLLDDTAVDLTGFTVVFNLWKASDGTQVITNGACTLVNAGEGRVEYTWTSADATLDAGSYVGSFAATQGGRRLTAPNNGLITIGILESTEAVWSYTGDPQSRQIDQVRFLAGDTDADNPMANDAEIEFLLDRWNGDYYYAAAAVVEHAANRAGAKADYSKSVGDLSISTQYAALATALHTRAHAIRDQAQMYEASPIPTASADALGDFKFKIDMDKWV
jgi:hypothetical protein